MQSFSLSSHATIISLTLSILLFVVADPSVAQWTSDTTVNTQVCGAQGDQTNPVAVTDENGGAIVAWTDYRSGIPSIYAQRLDADGYSQWGVNGIAIWAGDSAQTEPQMVKDGQGGAIVTWIDMRSGQPSLFAQRISLLGESKWTDGGVCVANNVSGYASRSDFFGGVAIALSGPRVQRLDSLGSPFWESGGLLLDGAADSSLVPGICADSASTIFCTWDTLAQKITKEGSLEWGSQGLPLKLGSTIVSNGRGGILSVVEIRTDEMGFGDVFIRDVDSDGNILWDALIGSYAPWMHSHPSGLVPDYSGGAYYYYERIQRPPDVYFGKVDSLGVLVPKTYWWGLPITPCSIAETKSGGALFALFWANGLMSEDYHLGVLSGASETGIPVTVTTVQYVCEDFCVADDGCGGAITVWGENRNGEDSDIFAQVVRVDGALPVELADISVGFNDASQVVLRWKTESETNTYGFEVERRSIDNVRDGASVKSISRWGKIGSVAGSGTSAVPINYSFEDKTVSKGRYSYRLRQIDRDGSFSYSREVEIEVGTLPGDFVLEQNYPNPFNPSTRVCFSVPVQSRIKLSIFSVLGQRVAILLDEDRSPGNYECSWTPQLPSGVYICCMESYPAFDASRRIVVDSKRMILLR